MGPQVESHTIDWLSWTGETFARARAARKPVLLAITAPWSHGCGEMDRATYGDPDTAALLNERVVAIRVDADHRPDIVERYDLGGLPTTALLTPDGDLLGGGTFVTADRLRTAVTRLAQSPMPGRPAGAAARPATERARPDETELLDIVGRSFDEEHAAFGGVPRFPLTAPVRLALDLSAEENGEDWRDRAIRTLDAMGWGPLYDEDGGGFFRCATRPDWSQPQPEKLLHVNAALLSLYVHAAAVLGHERWLARALDVAQYINRAHAAANGAWRLSPADDATRQFSDANALTASAMLHAAGAVQDDALGRRALAALERVLLSSYRPGLGVGHSAAGMRGLLADQVAMAAANLDAWEATGNIVYRMMAEELMHYALRVMSDEDGGGLFDCAACEDPDDPLSRVRLRPFALSCDAAITLRRLAEATDDPSFGARAAQVLDAVADQAAAAGPLAAQYLLARRAVLR